MGIARQRLAGRRYARRCRGLAVYGEIRRAATSCACVAGLSPRQSIQNPRRARGASRRKPCCATEALAGVEGLGSRGVPHPFGRHDPSSPVGYRFIWFNHEPKGRPHANVAHPPPALPSAHVERVRRALARRGLQQQSGPAPAEIALKVWNGRAKGYPNWYVYVKGNLIGDYPAATYGTGAQRATSATYLQVGGEVFDSWPNGAHTNTSIGSGKRSGRTTATSVTSTRRTRTTMRRSATSTATPPSAARRRRTATRSRRTKRPARPPCKGSGGQPSGSGRRTSTSADRTDGYRMSFPTSRFRARPVGPMPPSRWIFSSRARPRRTPLLDTPIDARMIDRPMCFHRGGVCPRPPRRSRP